MNCSNFKNNLPDLLVECLPHSIREEMEKHLRRCGTCRLEYEKMQKTFITLKTDRVPRLSDAKRNTLFPLVMERIEKRTRQVKKRKFSYALSFGFALILALVFTIVGIKSQKPTDYRYAFMTNLNSLIYQEDSTVTNYIATSLIENDTIISNIKNAIDKDIIEGSKLSSLVTELSSEEVNTLVEKLKNTNFDNI